MGLFTSASYMSSHGNLTPVRSLYTVVFCYFVIPAGAIAYKLSSGSILVTITAAAAIPLIGLSQGAWGVINYRFYFGKAPVPISPCHGVVICGEPIKDKSTSTGTENQTIASAKLNNPIEMNTVPLSLGCECGTMHPSGNAFFSNISGNEAYNKDTRRPIRLLVIGDSLAIGVGQSRQCTPVMPEVLAKTLSARLGGRTVFWTCHGAIGASTGWIIRELERGVKKVDNENSCFEDDDEENENVGADKGRNCSDTDDSSISDESATLSSPPQPLSKVVEMVDASVSLKEQRTIWRERLAQHRKYLDPDVSGQYDVVVVMAGGNDLKSGLFPFLCTGEDAEFRRQANSRGGNYSRELSRLVQIVKRDVRSKLRHIRYTVEAAAETVIEKVEQNIELIAKSTASPTVRRMSATASSLHELIHAKNERFLHSVDSELSIDELDSINEERSTKKSPLVVLPGLASRSLPVFRPVPLNWGAVLVVDILDMHKRRLAQSCSDEVIFVPPASPNDMQEYESCKGQMWQQRCEENTLLALRDVRRHECRRVEKELRDYYSEKDKRQLSGEGFKIQFNNEGWLSSLFTFKDICPGLFSIDRVHPNENGYDFYGRYIGNSIADEWLANPKLIPPE